MKNYIKKNIVPIYIGIAIGMLTFKCIDTVNDMVMKVYILNHE